MDSPPVIEGKIRSATLVAEHTSEFGCPVCGDGFVEEHVEECDDGNAADGDGCSSECVIE